MLIDQFVTENRVELLEYIRGYMNRHWTFFPHRDTSNYTNQDIVRWIMNDNELYQRALASGVECA